jgi:lipoprotein NlpD
MLPLAPTCRRLCLLCIGAAGWLAGCASNEPAPVVDLSLPSINPVPTQVAQTEPVSGNYRVVRGDTLYAIAFKHGLDYRDLAAWNGIAAPYRIFAGQELRLKAPAQVAHTAPPPEAAVPVAPASAETGPAEVATTAAPDRVVAVTTSPVVEKSTTPQPMPFETVAEPVPAPSAPPQSMATPAPAVAPAASSAPANPEAASVPKPAVQTAPKTEVAVARPPAPVETPRAQDVPELSSGGVRWRWPSDGKVIAAYVSGDPTRQGIDIGGKAGDAVHAAAEGEVVYSGNGLIGYGELIIVKHNASFLSAYGHNRSRLVKEGDKVKAGQPIAEMGSSASARDELHFEIRKNGKPVNPLEYLPAR